MRFLTAVATSKMLLLFAILPLGYMLSGMDGALAAIVASQFAGWPLSIGFGARHRLNMGTWTFIGLPIFLLAAGMGWLLTQLIGWLRYT
jgi:hypothetical protein